MEFIRAAGGGFRFQGKSREKKKHVLLACNDLDRYWLRYFNLKSGSQNWKPAMVHIAKQTWKIFLNCCTDAAFTSENPECHLLNAFFHIQQHIHLHSIRFQNGRTFYWQLCKWVICYLSDFGLIYCNFTYRWLMLWKTNWVWVSPPHVIPVKFIRSVNTAYCVQTAVLSQRWSIFYTGKNDQHQSSAETYRKSTVL